MDDDRARGAGASDADERQHPRDATSERASLLPREDGDGGRARGRRTRAIAAIAATIAAAVTLGTAARRGRDGDDARATRASELESALTFGADEWAGATYETRCDGVLGDEFAAYANDNATLSETARWKVSKTNGQTYVNGFWRLAESHHPPEAYLPRVRVTACQLGAFGMNVVFVRDDQRMCDWTMALYEEGAKSRGKYQYGGGAAECVVHKAMPIRPTQCSSHERIWHNKLPVVAEVAKRIESGELSPRLRAEHYFWLDGDLLAVNGERGGSPGLGSVFHIVSRVLREQDQDKSMVRCYRHDAVVGSIGACPWMRREVLANVFGGSARAVEELHRKYRQYIDEHVPTVSNGGHPTGRLHCPCPTEEAILTTMANDKAYADLFTQASCAHDLREPYKETTGEYSWVRDP